MAHSDLRFARGWRRQLGEDDWEAWRQAEHAALKAEEAARSAARSRTQDRHELGIRAKALRKHADRLFSEGLPSRPAPLAPQLIESPFAVGPSTAATTLKSRIAEWRRAQARAHAAEVRVVHAYLRCVEGSGEQSPLAAKAEAAALRLEAAERLQRVYATAEHTDGRGGLPPSRPLL
jgi:hypothetical protein